MTDRIYLTVPFAEKDAAKAAGARWDSERRQWFAPANLPREAFAAWLGEAPVQGHAAPTTSRPHADAPPTEGQGTDAPPGIPLADYLANVQRVIQHSLATHTWVVAEITEAQIRNGHLYVTLSQTRDGVVIASTRANAFSVVQRTWYRDFTTAVGGPPQAGMRVLAKVSARFDARYGFALEIHAIDEGFTLGAFAQRVAKLRAQLQAEGVYDRQRQLPAPKDFTAIAIVAPAGAAGLGDFSRDTNAAEAAGLLVQRIYTATFQGADAEASVTAAIARAVKDHASSPVDAIVVIRGGGSAVDLAWLDAIGIARAVATAPVPVLVGVGHERDRGILNEVGQPFDTPSKVSAHILRTITDRARAAVADLERITRRATSRIAQLIDQSASRAARVDDLARGAMQRRASAVASVHARAVAGAQRRLLASTLALRSRWDHLATAGRQRLDAGTRLVGRRFEGAASTARARLTVAPYLVGSAARRSHEVAARRMATLTHAVERYHLIAIAADPARILARGYAVVRDGQGRVIDAHSPGGAVAITWRDGTRHAQLD